MPEVSNVAWLYSYDIKISCLILQIISLDV